MFTRIFLGFAISVLGFLFVWKTDAFYSMLGAVPWAERTFGGGGTRAFYKLLGVGILLIGVIVMTNLFDIIVGGFLRSIFVRG